MKKTILFLALTFTLETSFAQSFLHGAGISVMAVDQTRGDNNAWNYGWGLTYTPRFNFLETEQLAVSVGIPLTVRYSLSSSIAYSQSGYSYNNSSIGIVENLPLIGSLNYGRGSTRANRSRYGFFVGGGFAYEHGDYFADIYDPATNSYIENYSTNVFGPAANAGARIGIGRKHRNIEVRLSYMKALNELKPNVFGLACLFNF